MEPDPRSTPPSVRTTPPASQPPVQPINVRTEAPPPQRSSGSTGVILAIVAIAALVAILYFVFLRGGAEAPGNDIDINVDVPEVQAPEMPDVNIEVPEVELPEVEVPDVDIVPGGDAE